MAAAVREATAAYSNDVNKAGVCPAQASLGKRPRMSGDVLGRFYQAIRTWLHRCSSASGSSLSHETKSHGGDDQVHLFQEPSEEPSEEPRLLHSFGYMTAPLELRLVYFWRESKYNPRGSTSKRELLLRQWRGPALLVFREGRANVFVSFRGPIDEVCG